MENEFINALVSTKKNDNLPDHQNIFGSLIGAWDFEWIDNHGTAQERHMKGEWIFSWTLDGTAIQDVFICPSREERVHNQQPDAAYATTIRIYNPTTEAWDIFYGCTGDITRLEARKEGNNIVLTEVETQNMKWIFSDITKNSFHWQNIMAKDGNEWKLLGELFATRKIK